MVPIFKNRIRIGRDIRLLNINVRTSKIWRKSKETKRNFFENLPGAYKDLIQVKKKFKNISCLCTFKAKNQPNLFWLRNPPNCRSSVEQQQSLLTRFNASGIINYNFGLSAFILTKSWVKSADFPLQLAQYNVVFFYLGRQENISG